MIRPRNYGCGRHLVDVRRRIFDLNQYDAAVIFEDDFVPPATYLQEMMNLLLIGFLELLEAIAKQQTSPY